MRTIKLKSSLTNKNCKEGGYGLYCKVSKRRGVKVIDYYGSSYTTIKSLKRSSAYKDAVKELNLLKKARKRSNLVPNGYEVVAVKIPGVYRIYVGILMLHIPGKVVGNCANMEWDSYNISCGPSLKETLEDKLKSKGIYHSDLHDENVIYRKGKFYAIDFSPAYVDVI